MKKAGIPYKDKQRQRGLWFGFLLCIFLLVVVAGNIYYFTRDAFSMSQLNCDRFAVGVIVEAESILKNNKEILNIAQYGILRMKGRDGGPQSAAAWMQEFSGYSTGD